jgi:hypothetical protein
LKFLSDPFAMASGDLILRPAFPGSDLPLQGSPQEGKVPISLDPVKLRFDAQQGRSHPAFFLVAVSPAADLAGPPSDLRQERLQAVGGLQGKGRG